MGTKIIAALCAVGLVGLVSYFIWQSMATVDETHAEHIESVATGDSTTVTLTQAKIASANVMVGEAAIGTLQANRTIAGRLDYDQDLHVDIKSACDGILTEILVHPGDHVTVGQSVAIVSSPEVGMARSEVRARIAELKLAETQQKWNSSICSGVEQLAAMIRQGQTPQAIEDALQDDSLGQFREKLVSAYTRQRLASSVVETSRDAASRGAIAASVQRQRESEQQTASAALDSTLEQSLFEVQQQCSSASAELAQAERLVDISLQRLNTLLGPAAAPMTKDQFENVDATTLSNVNLISPIEGTVEERNLSVNERVTAGESVFVVADCSRLWAVADIRERDWGAIAISVGEKVEISSPAIPGLTFEGEVFIVGRRFDPSTGAAPLIARLEVPDGRLRPGLFIRMTIPTSGPREVLLVPEQAIVVHEGQHFVFVAESESQFRRVDVEVGETQSGQVEILSGLKAGARIAIRGVFTLKSELLLAGEEE